MNAYVVAPTDIYGAQNDCFPSGAFATPNDLVPQAFTNDELPYFVDAGFSGGSIQCVNSKQTPIGGLVAIFEAHDATRAAFLVSKLALSEVSGPSKQVTVPGVPDATVVEKQDSDGNAIVVAMATHEQLISYVYASVDYHKKATEAQVQRTADTLLKAQVAKTATFTPTPADKLGSLDDDPELLDGLTYQPPEQINEPNAGGYPPRLYAHFDAQRQDDVALLRANGFREMYVRIGDQAPPGWVDRNQVVELSRLASPAAAARVYAGEIPVTAKSLTGYTKTRPPKTKGITCFVREKKSGLGKTIDQTCLLAATRYLIFVQLDAAPKDGTKTTATDFTAMLATINAQLKLTPR